MPLPITLTIAAASALIALWLGFRVMRLRLKTKILHGDGGNRQIERGMRAHANFVEYAPFVLILMALIELARGPSPWLWVAGIAFVVARLLHPFGMDRDDSNVFRAAGILVTLAVLLGLAVWAIAIPYSAR